MYSRSNVSIRKQPAKSAASLLCWQQNICSLIYQMKWVNKGILNSYFPALDIFTFLPRSEALMNNSPSFHWPSLQEAPRYQCDFQGCYVAIGIDEITLARHTSLDLLVCLFKCFVCYWQGIFYLEYYFTPFSMHFFKCGITANGITEEWGWSVFGWNSRQAKSGFSRSTIQSQPEIWFLFLL